MEIKSPVQYVEEPVRHFDVLFINGESRTDTLEPEIPIIVDADTITIQRPGDEIVIERRNICWRRTRDTYRRRIVKPPKPSVADPGTNVAPAEVVG